MAQGIHISLDGDAALIAKLAALPGLARGLAVDCTEQSVEAVKNRMIDGISSPPKTGRVYTTYFATSAFGGVFPWGSRPAHQASAQGEYPASDTGNLIRSIWAEVEQGLSGLASDDLDTQLSFNLNELMDDAGRIRGVIGVDADYAAPLEYKPPERGGRPFATRALAESRDQIYAIFFGGMAGKFSGGA